MHFTFSYPLWILSDSWNDKNRDYQRTCCGQQMRGWVYVTFVGNIQGIRDNHPSSGVSQSELGAT